MKLVHKVMDFTLREVDDTRRSFWAVASTGKVDRQGDLVEPSGWHLENFLKNPVIPWAHDYSRPPVARALEVKVEDGRLLFLAQFAPAEDYAFADTVFRLYRGGFLRAFSVGFLPLESELMQTRQKGRLVTGTRYLEQELYEISCVTLPANPEALSILALGDNPQPFAVKTAPAPSPAHRRAAPPEPAGALVDRIILRRLARLARRAS